MSCEQEQFLSLDGAPRAVAQHARARLLARLVAQLPRDYAALTARP
jgi:hypothetical protein